MKRKSADVKTGAILLVIFCTFLTATAQVLLKLSASNLHSIASIVTNYYLIAGCILYGIGAILLILALRKGELSVLYPFIALGFVWVALLSIVVFHESISLLNWMGMASIMIGVSLIGVGSK